LAASLPTLPVRLACHGRSSEHVGENEMRLLTGGEQANVVRGDDLEVRPPSEVRFGFWILVCYAATASNPER